MGVASAVQVHRPARHSSIPELVHQLFKCTRCTKTISTPPANIPVINTFLTTAGETLPTPLVLLEDGKNQRHRMTPNQQGIAKANDIEPENRELHHYWGEGWADGYGCGYKDGVANTRIGIGVCGLVMLAVWLLIRVWF